MSNRTKDSIPFLKYFKRQVLSWAMYDFANSAFATAILSVIFNVYFVKVICAQGVRLGNKIIPGESFWGYGIAFSMLLVFFLSPILGVIADQAAWKKKFLFFFWVLGVIFTGGLYFCKEGDYWAAIIFFALANMGFAGGNAFYNALLHDISTPESFGRISGFGWAMGYLGGGLLLAIDLMIIQKPEWFFLPNIHHLPVRVALVSVSVWWGIFALPLFLWVPERSLPKTIPPILRWVPIGIQEVVQTFKRIKENKEVLKYLLAFIIYNDGIETVILMASIFGAKVLGMMEGDLILCFLMIQGIAFFGALIFGHLADWIGHKKTIQSTLVIYGGVCVWAAQMQTQREFWILGGMVGLILGGSQAASRSLLALMVPENQSSKYFGFFALAGKLATVIGPLVFAVMSQLFSLRAAVAFVAVFFVVGLAIFHFVHEPNLNKLSAPLKP